MAVDGQIHHRRPRGMGGTKRLDSARPSNGVLLHARCHQIIESNRTKAFEDGYLVHQNQEPQSVPIRIRGRLFLLDDFGNAVPHDDVGDVDGVGTGHFLQGVPLPAARGVIRDQPLDQPF